MNPTESTSDRGSKAVEALIAASLHLDESPVEPAVVAKYMKGDFVLTSGEEKALEKCGRRFSVAGVSNTTDSIQSADVESDEVMALHRNKPRGGFSARTEEELDRKRRELRERLRQKRDKKKT